MYHSTLEMRERKEPTTKTQIVKKVSKRQKRKRVDIKKQQQHILKFLHSDGFLIFFYLN